jgi:hypothetical protein
MSKLNFSSTRLQMGNLTNTFQTQRQKDAYYALIGLPLSKIVDELQDEFPHLNLEGYTGPKIEKGEVTAQFEIFNNNQKRAVSVITFKLSNAIYGVSLKDNENKIVALSPAHTPEEAIAIAKEKLKQQLTSW